MPLSEKPLLNAWVQEIQSLCCPDAVVLIEGTEIQKIKDLLIEKNTVIPLNETLRPHSLLARSDPRDVARVESKTFISSQKESDAGPTNNWVDPKKMKETLTPLFSGCMKGRTLYVVPYCMGPLDSPHAKIGVSITDSAYVVLSMYSMCRVGKKVLEKLDDKKFVKCLHSVGYPLSQGQKDVPWPCSPENLHIAHFPETHEVWSFGSGYGGNALMNKKCFALRIGSVLAKEEGWLAEHMLIVGVTNPKGEKRYFAAAFPSACGKTNLAMLQPTLPGWKISCVGDDIAWMRWGKDGRLWAVNPEAGFFGVAPGTSMQSNPNAMQTMTKNTIFTNVALTDNGDVWWEGMTKEKPSHLIDWKGHDWTPQNTTPAAHGNARFTAPCNQCPVIDPDWESPEGVPISGIIFGGRRADTRPLVSQARSWEEAVFYGASMSSETTAAAVGAIGELRHDPFAMLPFCGYNMADYFAHWLSMERPDRNMPEVFYVNWFLQNEEKQFIWPGFGENIRALSWMFDRIEKRIDAVDTPIGFLPKEESFPLEGLTLSQKDKELLFTFSQEKWKKEASKIERYFELFRERLPDALKTQVQKLQECL